MLHRLDPLPPDPLLGLTDRFRADSRPHKVDLGVGMYQDEAGNVQVMRAIRAAEEEYLRELSTLSYVGPPGVRDFVDHFYKLALGDTVPDSHVASVQSIAGTGALFLLMSLVKKAYPDARIWLPVPTWPNHHNIADRAGLEVRTYPYYDKATHQVTFEAMTEALTEAGPHDVVLFHACCHNPAGGDPTPEQWKILADQAANQGFQVLMDSAYLGLGDGLEADAEGMKIMAATLPELMIALSASKSFGVYRDRVGAAIVVSPNSQTRYIAQSQLNQIARSVYSVSPAHGATVIAKVLTNPEYFQMWRDEVEEMGARLRYLRETLSEKLRVLTDSDRFDFITQEKGMFSFLGLSEDQVARIIDDFAVYCVSSSRINVGGLRDANLDYVANAVATVIRD